MDKPTIPEVLPLIRQFARTPGNEVGGVLHIVLDESNVHDDHVRYCLDLAEAEGDTLGAEVSRTLLRMSKTQRGRLAGMFYQLQEGK